MKRITFVAVALSLLVTPLAAQAQSHGGRTVEKRFERSIERPGASGYSYRKKETRKNRFERGHRYTNWKKHDRVRDWKRQGLRRPAHGQQWVRVGNDYLLISVASGIIAGIIAGR